MEHLLERLWFIHVTQMQNNLTIFFLFYNKHKSFFFFFCLTQNGPEIFLQLKPKYVMSWGLKGGYFWWYIMPIDNIIWYAKVGVFNSIYYNSVLIQKTRSFFCFFGLKKGIITKICLMVISFIFYDKSSNKTWI